MSVGPYQHSRGSRDRADDRELPRAGTLGVDKPDTIGPVSDIEIAGFTKIQQHALRIMEQREGPQATVDGDQISVGIYPLRNGQPGGLLFSVTLANGTVFKGN